MQVKVHYEETILRTATCEVDEAEFLEWVNSDGEEPALTSVDEINAAYDGDLADLMLDYLQGGSAEVWAVGRTLDADPNAQVCDVNLVDVREVR